VVKSGKKWSRRDRSWAELNKFGGPVDLKAEIRNYDPLQPNTTEFCAVFACPGGGFKPCFAAITQLAWTKKDASRSPQNSSA
jgi:hypothetical protein